MKSDYTMNDFRSEMQRRGVYEDAYPDRSKRGPPRAARKELHGSAIIKVVPCGVHPLHAVKVRASGARSGCPMCEMQIEAMCSPRPSSTARGHAPRIALDRNRIVGCTCGWLTPPGTTDSDDAYVLHATVAR